jgi:hypothetical protein
LPDVDEGKQRGIEEEIVGLKERVIELGAGI